MKIISILLLVLMAACNSQASQHAAEMQNLKLKEKELDKKITELKMEMSSQIQSLGTPKESMEQGFDVWRDSFSGIEIERKVIMSEFEPVIMNLQDSLNSTRARMKELKSAMGN